MVCCGRGLKGTGPARGLPRMSERGARRKLEWRCIKLGVLAEQLGGVGAAWEGSGALQVRVAAQVGVCVGGGGRLTGMLGVRVSLLVVCAGFVSTRDMSELRMTSLQHLSHLWHPSCR